MRSSLTPAAVNGGCEEVVDAASLAEELGNHADAERVVGLAPRRLLEDRAQAAVDRPGGTVLR